MPWTKEDNYFGDKIIQNCLKIDATHWYDNNLVVWISERKLDDFYHTGFSDYYLHFYCYIHNVSADVSSRLLQVFLVELRSLLWTSNHIFYLIHGIRASNPRGLNKRRGVIYWPSTQPSIKRGTCVNKRKNSGSRWALENNITRCPGGSSQLETGCKK